MPELKEFFVQSMSINRGYLLSNDDAHRQLCLEKMTRDMSILDISISLTDIVINERNYKVNLLDQLGFAGLLFILSFSRNG